MLRTMKDVHAEYSNFEELKRMRQAYIVHMLDLVLSERSMVMSNDLAIKEEESRENGPVVGLDNVFELAKEGSNSESESEESIAAIETIANSDLLSIAPSQ
jgi:hypothetical protein